jgi:drug/metabolite transporter (DMT)-like permease
VTPADQAGVVTSGRLPALRERRLAEAGLAITVLIWSANFPVVKAAIGQVGPLTFTSLRYVVATLTLFALVRWRTGAIRAPAGQWWRLVLLGVLGFGFYQITWTLGLTTISAGDSALIVAAAPVLTALLAGAVGLDRLTLPKAAGALVAFVGVALVVTSGQGLAAGMWSTGYLLTITAMVLWALYMILGTRFLARVDPLSATAWAILGGTLFLLPFGAWEAATRPAVAVSPAVLVAVVYSGSLAAGVSIVFVNNGIRVVGPARASATQFVVPFGAVLLGAVFLGESVAPVQLVGGIVIIVGVVLTRSAMLFPRRRSRPVAAAGERADQ